MKITYDAHQDTLRILFRSAPIHQTDHQGSGVTLDYDQHGQIVGMELTRASDCVSDPYRVDLEPELVLAGEAI